jgi:hypothetical protein
VQPQVQPLPGQLSPQLQTGVLLTASAHWHFSIVVSIVFYFNGE